MATFCDQTAAELGEQTEEATPSRRGEMAGAAGKAEPGEETEGVPLDKPGSGGKAKPSGQEEDRIMCGLADRAAKAGGDCCVPKSEKHASKLSGELEAVEKKQREGESVVESEELHEKGP